MRVRLSLAGSVVALLLLSAATSVPAVAGANVCVEPYELVANEELPVPAPPYGADLNRNGFQCVAQQGGIILLTDDVPEDLDLDQCGTAFNPVQFEPADEAFAAKDRNGDGIACIRVMEVLQANALELYMIRDN